ncbi:MAG: MBL fold metallo-hydrolase [Phycisphaerales bacterium]|nr:MBL fold metallo-hydrolase [Phycisphaerae bacterium]NNM24967.1 MBL fold metallo-hydrolase [Phycisphaerales bacterium]
MSVRDLELVVLGSGTSAGVPVIGCGCEVCASEDPRDRRTRTSACLRFVDRSGQPRVILLDASPDLREQALRHRLDRCDAIVFTHNHVDHTFGLDEVRRFNALMKASIDVYAESRTMEFLHRVYQHIFRRDQNVNDSFVATLVPQVIDGDRPLDLFGLRLTPVRMLHGRLPVLAYRVEALDESGAIAATQPPPLPLAYCTDVSAIPPESWPRLTELRTLVLDMLRYRKHATHFTVDEAIAAADTIAADRTWFIHMTHDIRHADLDPRLPAGMRLAYDGLVLNGSEPAEPPTG